MLFKMWFSKNGLVVRKLIILDVFFFIMVFYKIKYVFIFDKYVVVKVFDEVKKVYMYMYLEMFW